MREVSLIQRTAQIAKSHRTISDFIVAETRSPGFGNCRPIASISTAEPTLILRSHLCSRFPATSTWPETALAAGAVPPKVISSLCLSGGTVSGRHASTSQTSHNKRANRKRAVSTVRMQDGGRMTASGSTTPATWPPPGGSCAADNRRTDMTASQARQFARPPATTRPVQRSKDGVASG